MSTEIFYYRDEQGSCVVQDFLDQLDDSDRARCLAQIDLLEGDDLPAKMDRVIEDAPVRILRTDLGRERCRFIYLRRGDQAILFDAVEGKHGKAKRHAQREPIQQALTDIQESSLMATDRLKSHREHVAEITLSDPTFAALYARARELTQFSIAVMRMRTASGFTIDALAERTGLSRTRISSMERGHMPKLSTMRRLVDALQARIVITPGSGVKIEPFTVEVKRPRRPRHGAAEAATPNLSLSESK